MRKSLDQINFKADVASRIFGVFVDVGSAAFGVGAPEERSEIRRLLREGEGRAGPEEARKNDQQNVNAATILFHFVCVRLSA